MKCRACGQKAVVSLRAHNTAYCKADYIDWFEKNALRTMKRFKMMTPEDRVLVAVSGGKDSLALWHLLTRAGFQADGLYIAQGIGDEALPYSDRSEEACRSMAEALARPLRVARVVDELGATVPELPRITRRKVCSSCGLAKRYLMNREAFEGGYTVLATGHNLDDEASALFGNVLGWDLQRLAHQSPVSPQRGERLMKKVKPLCFFTEREVLAYTMLSRLRYLAAECPHSAGATSIANKELLSQLEENSPGSKRRFFAEFLRNRGVFERAQPEPVMAYCQRCAMPTTGEMCSFCRMAERVAAAKGEVHYRGLPAEEPGFEEPEGQVVQID
jgi:tRNA-5-methyluridine54 2-sulfurtransferase